MEWGKYWDSRWTYQLNQIPGDREDGNSGLGAECWLRKANVKVNRLYQVPGTQECEGNLNLVALKKCGWPWV